MSFREEGSIDSRYFLGGEMQGKGKALTRAGFTLLVVSILLIILDPQDFIADEFLRIWNSAMLLSMVVSLPLIVIGGIEENSSTKGGML